MSHLSRRMSRKDSLIEISEEDMAQVSKKFRITQLAEAIHEAEAEDGLMASFTNFEDYLFDILSEGRNTVYLSRFIWGLQNMGLQRNDNRLRESMKKLKHAQRTLAARGKDVGLDRETFKECINPNIVLIKRAFDADFVIPDFAAFQNRIEMIFEECQAIQKGKVATYIPQLARVDPNHWGVSICTVDGQRYNSGSTNVPFVISDIHHPLSYAICLNDLSVEYVNSFIGVEPSGETSNCIKLDNCNKPHNPMINSGAIVTASLIKNDLRMADRFDYVSQQYKKLAGGEFLGFNNAVYLSERETADRNFALGYYMQENNCFPPGVKLTETLDFYFQLCSVEVTCESAAVMAASLANGGLCPMTGEQVLTGEAVRNTLSLMHSCGMYDYSGQFAFNVGLPGKSGVSGGILLVIPNVMGICLWSPPLDQYGNSMRGIKFCEKLINTFNFHQYDNLLHAHQKYDPRRRTVEKTAGSDFYMLLFGSYKGDLEALKRLYLSGVDMSAADYDGRTALHLCASEGHLHCVKFLLKVCSVPHTPKDRWDHTPLSEARESKRLEVQTYLEQHINANPQG